MPVTDPDQVPATPIYTVTVSSTGDATLDGEPVRADLGQEPRVAALAEVRVKAALCGRAVRVNAKEPDGTVWPLLVDVDGTVTTLDRPHPTPAPPRAPAPAQAPRTPRSAPPAERPDIPAAVADPPHGEFTATYEPLPWTPSAQTPAAGPADQMQAWTDPLPPGLTYRLQWAQLVRQEQAGALAEAAITAERIETALAEEHGARHSHTVNVLTARAWLTLRAGAELVETAELLVETAERRREAGAQPEADTIRVIRNAHVLWRRLTAEDAETARELAERLLVLLDGDERRARDIVRWVESGGAALGAA
jgi:hypothetical protein